MEMITKIEDLKNIKVTNAVAVKVMDFKFVPVEGIKYCIGCGKELHKGTFLCGVCGGNNFTGSVVIGKEELNQRIGGYLRLSNGGRLKKYAKTRKVNVSKMSNKRVAWELLVKDGFFKQDDKESFRLIEKIYWKKS